MSTLQQRITALAQATGIEIKALNTLIGLLSGLNTTATGNLVAAINEVFALASSATTNIGSMNGLTTTNKSNLVSAINEVKAAVQSVDLTALLKDDAVAGDITHTYSVDKILSLLSTLETKIMGGISPEALDTIKELADFVSDNAVAGGIVQQMSNRVRVDAPQSFDSSQQAQGRANIGAASADTLSNLTQVVVGLNQSLSTVSQNLTTLSEAVGDTDHDFVAEFNAAKV